MKTSMLLHGNAREVSNELCSSEDVSLPDLIAALGNALNRIAALEEQLVAVQSTARQAAFGKNVASCGIIPD